MCSSLPSVGLQTGAYAGFVTLMAFTTWVNGEGRVLCNAKVMDLLAALKYQGGSACLCAALSCLAHSVTWA